MSKRITLTINRLEEVVSTQDSAKQLAEAGATEGTTVVARVQGAVGEDWAGGGCRQTAASGYQLFFVRLVRQRE